MVGVYLAYYLWSMLFVANIAIISGLNRPPNHNIPIYYINMDKMETRRNGMGKHFYEYGIGVDKRTRVSALTPETCNLLMVDSNCNRVSLVDIAIACTHIATLYQALHDESEFAKSSKYFLVLEDDVRFSFRIDFDKLIAAAPDDFGSLQLMMSHKLQIETAWDDYIASIDRNVAAGKRPDYFIHRPRNSTVWSAQAVLYNKEKIRSYLERAVVKGPDGKLGYKLLTSSFYEKNSLEKLNGFKPVIACSCLFADMLVYAVAQPSYILTVPAFNSALQGANSSYHQSHVPFHVQGFAKIENIQEQMLKDRKLIPDFLTPLPAHVQGAPGHPSTWNWTEIARKNRATIGHGVPKRFNNERR